ncbi:acetyltransferase [Candidatus Pacearchaeota archaeon]|nr:acetyltransferase [Candidatus Pacearchaeota archaeon]
MINQLPSNIILWGGTGQAKVVRPIIEFYGSKVDAVIDDTPDLKSPFNDVKLYCGYDGVLEYLKNKSIKDIGFLVTIGNNKTGRNSQARIKISNLLKKLGLSPISIVHPTSYVDKDVKIGEGIQIMAGAKIITETKIGDYCIVNTGANVDHECTLEDGVEIAPNATLCGLVYVGKYSWIGANATILPRIKIGSNSVIGAGSVVTKDVPQGVVVAGNPAKELYKINL